MREGYRSGEAVLFSSISLRVFPFVSRCTVRESGRPPIKRGVVVGDDRPGESGEKAEPFFWKSGNNCLVLTLRLPLTPNVEVYKMVDGIDVSSFISISQRFFL
jgi:hypothetical protein